MCVAGRTSRQKFEDPARSIHIDMFQHQQQAFLLDGLSPQPPPGSNGGTMRQWGAPGNGHPGATDMDDDVFTTGGGASADSGIHMSLLNPMDPSGGPTVVYRPPSRQSEKVRMRCIMFIIIILSSFNDTDVNNELHAYAGVNAGTWYSGKAPVARQHDVVW